MLIRDEQPADAIAIHDLLTAAFGRETEGRLVERLRGSGKEAVSLVAEDHGRVLGYVLFSGIAVERGERQLPVMALAPLAVLPAFQRLGLGSALVSEGLSRVRGADKTAVLVVGDPRYYGRFGFVPASRFGIRCPFPAPEACFMALELSPGALKGYAGLARYGHEFDDLE